MLIDWKMEQQKMNKLRAGEEGDLDKCYKFSLFFGLRVELI
jgi:hypothetical protein